MSIPELDQFPMQYHGQVGPPGSRTGVIYLGDNLEGKSISRGMPNILDISGGNDREDDPLVRKMMAKFPETVVYHEGDTDQKYPRFAAEVARFYPPYNVKYQTGTKRRGFKKEPVFSERTRTYGDVITSIGASLDSVPEGWVDQPANCISYGIIEKDTSAWFNRNDSRDEKRCAHFVGRVCMPSSVYQQYRQLTETDRKWPRDLSMLFTTIMNATLVPNFLLIDGDEVARGSGLVIVNEDGSIELKK